MIPRRLTLVLFFAAALVVAFATTSAHAQLPALPAVPGPDVVDEFVKEGVDSWTSPQRLSSSLQVLLLLTILSLAPAIVLMTTSFVRIVVVLGLLRQAIGTNNLPPSQVLTSAGYSDVFVASRLVK